MFGSADTSAQSTGIMHPIHVINLFLLTLIKPRIRQAELDEIDIDLDELLDMEDDSTRRHWLQVSLAIHSVDRTHDFTRQLTSPLFVTDRKHSSPLRMST